MTLIKRAGKSIFLLDPAKKGFYSGVSNNKLSLSMKNIAIQCLLRPALTVVERCADYDNFRAAVERIDQLLIDSEVESQAIEMALEER